MSLKHEPASESLRSLVVRSIPGFSVMPIHGVNNNMQEGTAVVTIRSLAIRPRSLVIRPRSLVVRPGSLVIRPRSVVIRPRLLVLLLLYYSHS